MTDDAIKTTYNGSETVMIADDQKYIRKVFEVVLRQGGYKVILAKDGQDAVDKFRDNPNSIDLIFMDIIMPHKDGIEAYKEILRLKETAKVIFMSGHLGSKKLDINQNVTILKKPVMVSDILRHVRQALDQPPADSVSARSSRHRVAASVD